MLVFLVVLLSLFLVVDMCFLFFLVFFFSFKLFYPLLVVSYNSLDTHKDIYTKCKAKHLFALHQIYLQLFCISERDEGRVKRYEAWRGFKVGAGIGNTRRGTRYGVRGTGNEGRGMEGISTDALAHIAVEWYITSIAARSPNEEENPLQPHRH